MPRSPRSASRVYVGNGGDSLGELGPDLHRGLERLGLGWDGPQSAKVVPLGDLDRMPKPGASSVSKASAEPIVGHLRYVD
ncbi:MAG: hypothetical protein AB1Z98_09520 [Nannocystaceae bacterium]